MSKWQNLPRKWQTLNVIFLLMLLTACASPIEPVRTELIIKLPPPGLIVPCDKPKVEGTWPEVVTEDIPKLKAALKPCAQQAIDYLNWRAKHEQPKESQND
ncbi:MULTISPECIES: Rz1-like lysis system protein LysC [Vibrio diabolicus subgroup]